jgi:hypothetical protein
MDKPVVADGRIVNAILLAFLAFDTRFISGLPVVLGHLPNSSEASVWKRWVSPESCNEVKSQSRGSLFGCGFRI